MGSDRVVIVGAGLAAAHVATTLREAGDTRPVTIVGNEGRRPYERPGLSKGVLQGEQGVGELFVHEDGWYGENSVDLRLDDAAVSLDLAAMSVTLASGEVLEYGDLVLATGARPRLVDLPGVELAGVHTLRRIEDCEALKAAFTASAKVVVVGAGWIGLEVAAAARKAGSDVTVLEYAQVPLRSALGDRMGRYLAMLHERNGVDLRTGVRVTAIEGDGRVSGVRTGEELFSADVVVVGVGAVPNVELAEQAGLDVDNGVLVDDQLRAADHVYAIGDLANAEHARFGRLHVEHWDNAIRQGRLAGQVLLGEDAHYDWQPYFFTDQFDLGMEYVGRGSAEGEVVLRGEEDSGEFIAFWLRDGVVTAAMNVNIWDVNDQLRALVGRRIEVARLTDTASELTDL